ncbi:MAG: indole-3-glycerol phosphate synthase TrpC [Thermoanaerobaculia bacterium]|nr:indole-3-glycerol phosphate synthase TrpC [Thermoanaerobaculia bacterium]
MLDDIVARTRGRLAASPPDEGALRRSIREKRDYRFARALAGTSGGRPPHSENGVRIIAEIKAASPSAGPIVPDPDVEAIARAYRDGGAAAVSVVTEPEFFRGSRDWIARVHSASALPVIMKDFVIEPVQLIEGIAAGADAILLIASLLDAQTIAKFIAILDEYGRDALVEVHDERELQKAIDGGARLIGVNNRDLESFKVDLATSERLAKQMPRDVIRVAESGIATSADVQRLVAAGFDAFLVGESLLRQNDRSAAVRRLRGGRET